MPGIQFGANHVYILTHTSRANRKTCISYITADKYKALDMIHFMKQSPKTKSVTIHESALSCQWPVINNTTVFADCPIQFIQGTNAALNEQWSEIDRALATNLIHKQNVWFKVWHQLTDSCRIAISNFKRN